MFQQFLHQHNSNHRKINQIIRPLCDAFPFTHVWYYSITPQGHYTCLGSNQGWMEYFFSKKIYKNISSFFRHPKYYQTSCSLFKSSGQDQLDADQPCHINSSLVMLEKNEKRLEGFGFGTHVTDPKIDQIFFNELPLLKKFTKFFKEEAKQLILDSEAAPLSLIEMLGASVFELSPHASSLNEKAKQQLLDRLGIKAPPQLSPREKQCLDLVLQGKSAGWIAKKLGLSLRTVEYYMECVKNKFGCNTKAELFDMALDYR